MGSFRLVNKLRPGTILRVDPLEDGFKSSSNLTKFHAAAARVFNLTVQVLFDQDDLLQGTPGGVFNHRTNYARRRRSFGRIACSR